MEQLHANIHELENKLVELKEKYIQQKSTIQKLEAENAQFKNAVLLQKQQRPLEYDNQKINIILQQLIHQPDKDIKKTLERYIKYIDQCIALLERSN
ncbi:MAG: hypothetical protein BGO68_04995 [Candidatus Amoebophilus sp. 36-38]|nr:MAG: hypothetical protein BGO68_04995 [Candidatus Amoebophilus sp. 36-38]